MGFPLGNSPYQPEIQTSQSLHNVTMALRRPRRPRRVLRRRRRRAAASNAQDAGRCFGRSVGQRAMWARYLGDIMRIF